MSDTKYIKLRTRNAKMMKMYGDKLTWVEKLINMRSNGLHTELQFSDRYGNISVSATMQDGCNCVRFKMIGYSHAYRWSTILIPVTAEQEARIFAEACRMANVGLSNLEAHLTLEPQQIISEEFTVNGCIYGLNAIEYDTAGVSLSFISKRRWWNPSAKRQWCNETVGLLLMVEWPDVFDIVKEDGSITFSVEIDGSGKAMDGGRVYQQIPPHEQTPDQTHYLIEHYFRTNTD